MKANTLFELGEGRKSCFQKDAVFDQLGVEVGQIGDRGVHSNILLCDGAFSL